ncbi:Pleckstrin like proteiny domain-containing family J member 1 [Chelonia mydas]|uniref:Pleckstrin homology domain-containing family J member 1 n=1 Tax=Chelonia mydas TaxID=8469 RepID=M7B0Y9_CHEMY|nr:Pleckstrin like proteiny domain-containing family J member 1 [Chelonia mydas]
MWSHGPAAPTRDWALLSQHQPASSRQRPNGLSEQRPGQARDPYSPHSSRVQRGDNKPPMNVLPLRLPCVLKKRLVKLVVNFLFYFRTDEAEPIGALLLEHCRITKEEENVFSISFIEEPDRKYSFECDTEEQCQEWIEALRRASYEFMRRSLIFYRNEIQKMTGKDPLEQYGISEEARFQLGTRKL